jgi:hypothetical protein
MYVMLIYKGLYLHLNEKLPQSIEDKKVSADAQECASHTQFISRILCM